MINFAIALAIFASTCLGMWMGWIWGRRQEARRVIEHVRLERLKRANQLKESGRTNEPYPDNGPPARNARMRVVSEPIRPGDKPPTRM